MKKLAVLAITAFAALALVACGSSDDNGDENATSGGEAPAAQTEEAPAGDETATAQKLSFVASADSGLAYTVTSETAEAGATELEIVNEQPVPHDVALEDESGEEIGATEVVTNDTSSTEVELEPGTYTFFCTVPGHREAGMEGTLTVE